MGQRRARAPCRRSPRRPSSEVRSRAVDLDQSALVALHARLVEPEPLDVGRRGRRRSRGSRTRSGLAAEGRPSRRRPSTSAPSTFAPVTISHVLLRDLARGGLGDVLVLERQDLRRAPRAASPRCRAARTPTRSPCPTRRRRSRRAASAARSSSHMPSGVEHAPAELEAEQRLGHRAASRAPPWSASISVPSNWPPIFTLPSSVTEPKPSIKSILFFLNSIADAAGERLDDLVAVRSRRRRSRPTRPSTLMPKSPACCDLGRAPRPRAASPWPGCRPRSGSARRRCPSRPRRSSCRAARRGSRPRSRPGRSRSRCSRTWTPARQAGYPTSAGSSFCAARPGAVAC